LGKRLDIDLIPARNLRRLIKEYRPQAVVCWDVGASEELRLAVLSSRVRFGGLLPVFGAIADPTDAERLRSNAHYLGLHVATPTAELDAYAQRELAPGERLGRLLPYVGRTNGIDKQAVRRQLGVPADAPVVMVDSAGVVRDRVIAVWALAIVRELYPELRIIMPAISFELPAFQRCRRFLQNVRVPEMLAGVDLWDPHIALAAADVYLEPMRTPGSALGAWAALAKGVAVVAGPAARPALGELAAYTQLVDAAKPRWLAGAVLALLKDVPHRTGLTDGAAKWLAENLSLSQYRAHLVALYRSIIQRPWRRRSIAGLRRK